MRVGAANGIAADYLARKDAQTVGLLGSGWQAGGQLLALTEVRNLKQVDVYSPITEHCQDFATTFDDRLDATVHAVESPEGAVRHKDIIVSATNSLDPIIETDWLRPGVHVTGVKKQEFTAAVFERANVAVLHSVEQTMQQNVILDGCGGGTPETEDGWWTDESLPLWDEVASLGDVIADIEGAPRRTDEDEVTLFMNNIGLGIQFATVGKMVYDRARELGLGTEESVDRYTQEYHP